MPVPRFLFKARIAALPCSSPVCLLMVLALSFHSGQAQQQTSKEAGRNQDEAIKLKAHLVTLDVMVKDNKGKYITDLKAQDFAVSENGVPQVVEFFDPPLASGGGTGTPGTTEATRSSKPGVGPSNILSLVLDGATTDLTNMKQVREGTLKYIRERITDTDTVAVFGVSTDLRLLQPFTRDKAKLIMAVENAYLLTASNKNLEQTHLAEDIERARTEAGGAGASLFQDRKSVV